MPYLGIDLKAQSNGRLCAHRSTVGKTALSWTACSKCYLCFLRTLSLAQLQAFDQLLPREFHCLVAISNVSLLDCLKNAATYWMQDAEVRIQLCFLKWSSACAGCDSKILLHALLRAADVGRPTESSIAEFSSLVFIFFHLTTFLSSKFFSKIRDFLKFRP